MMTPAMIPPGWCRWRRMLELQLGSLRLSINVLFLASLLALMLADGGEIALWCLAASLMHESGHVAAALLWWRQPVWVELGLQTIHADTAAYIRRGYPLSTFETAVQKLHARHLEIIVHTILGLPGESPERMLATIDYLNHQPVQGIKLQLLHVLKGTDLADDYLAGKFQTLSREEYLDLLISCLEHLSPDLVIHRVTGDGPKDLLIAPLWSANKRMVLNSLLKKMKQEHIFQGKFYHGK